MNGSHHNDPNSIAVQVTDVQSAAPAPDPTLIDQLVTANHILFDQGIVDGFGHISVRHDKRPDRFLLARNMAPGHVTAGDIVEFTLDVVDGGTLLKVVESGFDKIPASRRTQAFEMDTAGWTGQMKNIAKYLAANS